MNLSDELNRDRRETVRSYSSSLMSNAKWRAVFSVLRSDHLGIRQIITKFIGSDETKVMGLPWLSAPHAFVDSLEFGPLPLIGIEWIEVPAMAVFQRGNGLPAEVQPQDTAAVRLALNALGRQFPLADTATGLRVIGHVR